MEADKEKKDLWKPMKELYDEIKRKSERDLRIFDKNPLIKRPNGEQTRKASG